MPNRLANETSPYLQQHADNPVDWYPWGEEALKTAQQTGKPILLSVGYSACHWCHVMAHESFEDPATAKVMNDLFVNIKVDREERPDIDQIYQLAQAMLTQRNGGWPLTMFLTPEQLPFFGGTYFPPSARYGLPGFAELLKRVREFYDRHPDEIREQGTQMAQALARSGPRGKPGHPSEFSREPLDEAANHLAQAFDREHGGFSGAPKFPHPDSIELLLRRYAATRDGNALNMAAFTLRRMAEGGIYDQVGGGFARYSVDAQWAIPHFEKMLYDNGWLLRLYADAWAATHEPLFEKVCAETAGWVMREMQSPEGGYYSSLDADSEGEEGKFYVWTLDEIAQLLAPQEFEVATVVFGLDRPPNFENRAWHLSIAHPLGEAARMLEMSEGTVAVTLDGARRKLREARGRRVRPGRDDKVLTSWNALMIAGMARAARAFGQPEWLASARRALDFIRATLWNDARLLATFKGGRAHLDAYLDDHAYLLAALIEVMQARFEPADLAWAAELGDTLLERFQDESAGGFFFTAHEHERLIHRPKPGPDNAMPSGNAVAALALHRLAFLTGETRYSDAAERTLSLFWPQVGNQPSAFGTLLAALEEQLEPPQTLVVSGTQEAFGPWRSLADRNYLPTTISLFIPSGTGPLPPPLAKPAGDRVNAWLCKGVTCLSPVDTPEKLRETLDLPTISPLRTTSPQPGAHP
jgi:uncharacterized protein YyaL (SSP411 family)